ncbi:MAG: hypothetical protein JSR93_03605 [Verrucomicrobia bacterium]|nr:hypothetical protein [Verrucomicrobiota bacterium]
MILRPVYKWQQSCHAPFDEVGPKWAGQGEWVKMASKGRFCRAKQFYNCLFSSVLITNKKSAWGLPKRTFYMRH